MLYLWVYSCILAMMVITRRVLFAIALLTGLVAAINGILKVDPVPYTFSTFAPPCPGSAGAWRRCYPGDYTAGVSPRTTVDLCSYR